jgi:hypothetical protein
MISILLRSLNLLPAIAILIAVIIIYIKSRSVAGILLIVSQIILILLNIFWTFLLPYLMQRLDLSYSDTGSNVIMLVAQIISLLSGFAFAAGLFLLAYQNLKEKRI